MTYEEALKIKETYEPSFVKGGDALIPKIVPVLQSDYIDYLADLQKFPISDEESKKYSSNGEFDVKGLMYSAYRGLNHKL